MTHSCDASVYGRALRPVLEAGLKDVPSVNLSGHTELAGGKRPVFRKPDLRLPNTSCGESACVRNCECGIRSLVNERTVAATQQMDVQDSKCPTWLTDAADRINWNFTAFEDIN